MRDAKCSSSLGGLPLTCESARDQGLVLTAAFLGWMFDGLEQAVFPLVSRPALQDLLRVEDDRRIGQWMGIITAAFLLGAAGGGLVFGWLGDRAGRVRAMAASILAYSLFTGCCYFVQTPWQFAVFRFLSAVGMGGEWSLGVALVMECWPDKSRPWLAGAIGIAANAGIGVMGLLGSIFPVAQHSWRWVMLAGTAPALLSWFVLRCVPESARWRHAVETSAPHPLRGILRKTTVVAVVLASIALMGTWGSVQWLPAWADQLTDGRIQYAKGLTQLLTGVGAIAGCMAGALLAGRIGRRPAYFLLCLASLGSCAFLFRAVHQFGALFLTMVFLAGAATTAFYGWLPLYLPELFPAGIRATGQGVCYNSGRILAAAGALEMGRLLKCYNGSYARAGASLTLIYALGLFVIWLAPETKGKPLPE